MNSNPNIYEQVSGDTYRQLSEAIVRAYALSNEPNKHLREWRIIYTFLKSFTHAEVSIENGQVVAEINGTNVVIKS